LAQASSLRALAMQAFGRGMQLFGGSMALFESEAQQRCGTLQRPAHCARLLGVPDEDGPRIITRSGKRLKRALVDDADRKFARTASDDESTGPGTDEAAESASDAGSGSAEA